jgi:hypothetical protein
MATEIKLKLPCSGRITQLFGENVDFYKRWGYCCGHNGIDFGVANGTSIVAAAAGEIDFVGFEQGGYGNYIRMVHDGFLTYYAHLQKALVKTGDKIGAGEQIALSNNTGASTGPHLHFGLKVPGCGPGMKDYIDPAPYLGLSPHDPPEEGQNLLLVDFRVEVIIYLLKVRNGAGTQYDHVGDVRMGETYAMDAVVGFVKNCLGEAWFRYADGEHKGNWSAGIYGGETYTRQVLD